MKKQFVMLAFVLVLLLCFAGCQETPEKQAVINKEAGIPQEALITDGTPQNTATEHYESVSYQNTGRWEEEIQKDENFSMSANVDVQMPDVSVYPVQKLAPVALTQERANELIAYFAGEGVSFFKYPMPMTKSDWEARILELKESLAQVEAGGDGEDPDAIREYINKMEQSWAKAPEKSEPTPVDTNFTFMTDYDTGEPRTEEGENFISISGNNADGTIFTINAARAGETNISSYFSYSNSSTFEMEQNIAREEEFLAQDRERALSFEEPYRSEEIEQIAEREERVASLKAKYAQNNIDLDAMQQKAIGVLRDLGVTGVQITTCGKAIFEPNNEDTMKSAMLEYVEPTQPGCLIEFRRECGGIPCVVQNGGHWGPGMTMEGKYSAPYYPEQGYLLLDEAGTIRAFSWSDQMSIAEEVASDSKILTFDEAKSRIVDHLYWNNISHEPQDDRPPMKFRFVVEEAKLIMGYINVKDEPDRTMAVPAWYVKAQGYTRYADENGNYSEKEDISNYDEVIINALDGSPILMPGIKRMEEDMASMQIEGG